MADSKSSRPSLPPQVAQSALRKLVASELALAGFDKAHPDALDELEGIVWAFFGALLQQSHNLAELARRTKPTAKDVVLATAHLGIGGVKELKVELGRDTSRFGHSIAIEYDKKEEEVEEGPTLASDDEEEDDADGLDDLNSFRSEPFIAPFLPQLPAKHSYRQTPVFPDHSHAPLLPTPSRPTQQTPSAAALAHLSTLRSRLNDSQLVASSLRNLIRRTGTGSGSADGGGGGGGDAEDEDVVDFESVWYADGKSLGGGGGGGGRKRKIGVIKVGGEGEGESSRLVVEDEEENKTRRGEKRRKWRV